MADPARTPNRTYEERRRIAQQACREIPCASATHYPSCVFCPWENKRDKAAEALRGDASPTG